MLIDIAALSGNQVYFTMTQALIPRPIAWVLSANPDAGYNLAPFSYFTAVSSSPALVMLSIGKKPDGSLKDTIVNAEREGRFVIHIPHAGQRDAVTASAATLDHGESEVEMLDLELVPFEGFSLPRLADSRLAMACELYDIRQIGDLPQTLLFGKVTALHLDDEIVSEDAKGRLKIMADRVDPLGRLGAEEYLVGGDVVRNVRPR